MPSLTDPAPIAYGKIYINNGVVVEFCDDSFKNNTGGGIDISSLATVSVDELTANHTVKNSVYDIEGPYTLQNC